MSKYLAVLFLFLSGCAFSIGGTSYPDKPEESSAKDGCDCSADTVRLSKAFGMSGPDERRALADAYKTCIQSCRERCRKEAP